MNNIWAGGSAVSQYINIISGIFATHHTLRIVIVIYDHHHRRTKTLVTLGCLNQLIGVRKEFMIFLKIVQGEVKKRGGGLGMSPNII